jgi:hypothetical protein
MIYETVEFDEQVMRTHFEEFKRRVKAFYAHVRTEYERIKDDKGALRVFKQRYSFFEKNDLNRREYIHELFKYQEFYQFREIPKFREYLFRHLRKKIRGIYKHGQSGKTEICCEKILSDLRQNRLTVAITKNTLLANKQFTSRFVKCMKSRFGLTSNDLKKEVIVISSEINDLDGNATHCKNLGSAWNAIFANDFRFSVIFVCANATRMDDVSQLLERFNSPALNETVRKDIVIQYDEAHNTTSGIPVYRELIENSLLYDFVKEVVPITASGNPINKEDNPLWRKETLEENRIDFRNEELLDSLVTSDSEHYSSVADYLKVSCEKYFSCTKEYDNHISVDTFNRVYPENTKNYLLHGKLDAFPNMPILGQETVAVNAAKEILENDPFSYDRVYGDGDDIRECTENHFLKDEFNLHIMITPARMLVTRYLMEHAVIQPYHPVVIGLYGRGLHFMYIDEETGYIVKSPNEGKPVDKKNAKEFNDQLYEFLTQRGLLNRCVILMGNYLQLGESNTFVHNAYGYIRSVIRLPGCCLSIEEDYQFILRGCFLLKRFEGLKKKDIIKFIIAPQSSIDNAKYYEGLNDHLVSNEREVSASGGTSVPVIDYVPKIAEPKSNIPVKYSIGDPNDSISRAIEAIKGKSRRNMEDKAEMLSLLQAGIAKGIIDVVDHNLPPIDPSKYTLTEFRCFSKSEDEEDEDVEKPNTTNDNWRFKSYHDHVDQRQPYDNGELTTGQCGLYSSTHIHINSKNGHRHYPRDIYMLFSK